MKMIFSIRCIRGMLAFVVGVFATIIYAEPGYPSKSIRLIVGYGAGTAGDIVARLVANKLQESYKHGVVVENKSGAGGQIAAQETARAAPDGYTLIMGAMPQFSIAPAVSPRLTYSPLKDFAAVTQVVTTDLALIVNPLKVPATSMREFVNWAKQQPIVFFGTSGPGTVGHLGAYFLADSAQIKIEPVHFKNTADAMSAMAGGHLHAWFVPLSVAAPQVKIGKVRVLIVTGTDRASLFPDVPTSRESGYPDVQFTSWYGVFAPAGTPATILEKLNTDLVNAAKNPDIQSKIEDGGSRVTATTREEFSRLIADDTVRWGKAVKSSGFKIQD